MPKKRHGWDKQIELLLTPWVPRNWDPEAFEELIDAGVFDSEAENDLGENYMFVAARSGSADMVKFLLQKGVAPDKKSSLEEIPVHIALDAQNIEMLEALITADIRIAWSEEGSALKQLYIRALKLGKEKSAIFLIEKMGVDPEYKDEANNNEFHFCAKYKMLELAKFLPLTKRFYENSSKFEKTLEVALLKDHDGSFVVDLIESLEPDLQKSTILVICKSIALIKKQKNLEAKEFLDSSGLTVLDDARIGLIKGIACINLNDWIEAEKNVTNSLVFDDMPSSLKAFAKKLLYGGYTEMKDNKEGALSLLPPPKSKGAMPLTKTKKYEGSGSKLTPPYSTAASEPDEGYNSDCGSLKPPFPVWPSSVAPSLPAQDSTRGLDWVRGLLGLVPKTENPIDLSLPPQFFGRSDEADLDVTGDYLGQGSSM